MCGITGFLQQTTHRNQDTEAYTRIISTMTDRLTHRGPDDAGIWFNLRDHIALGHRRLSILDLSASGHQPMHSQNDRYVMVYNGEIYNFLELKKSLQTQNYHFSGHSDTEVILALITEYGLEHALTLMSGMFALALWDKKEKILHLARDRIGEKPLYYGFVNNSLVFASELKAIRSYPDFQNPINRTSLTLLLQYGYIPAPHSIFESIYKLMPGTYLSLSQSIIDKHRSLPDAKAYWSAAQVAEEGLRNPLLLSDAQAISQTEQLLSHGIKNRMIADVPIGAFLSGGIDSSLVAALMQTHSARPIKTFTIGFHDHAYNEAHYAKAVAQHLQTDHTELYVDSQQALAIIPKLPVIYDEPFADSSAIPTFLISQLTQQHVSVCLSGDGGDELFGGYNRYLLGKALWHKIALFPYPLRQVIRQLLLSTSPSRWQQLLRFLKMPNIGDKLHKFAGVVTARQPDAVYQHLISQWHKAQDVVIPCDIATAASPIQLHQFAEMDFIERMMLTDTLTYLPDDIMVKVDRAGMAVSLESRAPYLDHQLLEFLWKLPLNLKIRNHQTKWLLREILSKHVPNALFDRPKMGFAVPLESWLRGPLRDWAENLLDPQRLRQQGYLHAAPILQKWQEHLSGKRNWQYALWTILMFQAWLEQ